MSDGSAETKAVPARLRAEVIERDGHCCRMCGAFVEHPAVHHIEYRSGGGRHVLGNLVSVHWMYEPRCHEVAHANKRLWQPILFIVAATPGVTAFAVRRQLDETQGENGRSLIAAARRQLPRASRPLAGWPSAERDVFCTLNDDPISGPSAKGS